MANKRLRTSIRLDRQDIEYLKELGFENNHSEGVRWCVKFVKLFRVEQARKAN
jgi:hypothetical protein